ncbi:hypothetical protein V3C99_003930 [Haemonchus contortus]
MLTPSSGALGELQRIGDRAFQACPACGTCHAFRGQLLWPARTTLRLVDRSIMQLARNVTHQAPTRSLDAKGTNPSVNAVRRLLKETGLFGRRPLKKP